MIGAIIGDLAAWTWEHDKKLFYKELVSPKAFPSQLVKEILLTVNLLVPNENISQQDFCKHFPIASPTSTILRAIVIGWLCDTEEDTYNAFLKYGLNKDKEDWYAGAFIAKLIFVMRHGTSKKEAVLVQHISSFKSFCENKVWKKQNGILGTLVRAWDAFRKAFDYGSAIHNAMSLPGDKHLNGILVGALADAMYGCDMYLKKTKYGGGHVWLHSKFIPNKIVELCKVQRMFFPKNNANTNVERHNWTSVDNPYINKVVSLELRIRIQKAFYPTFDDRYGLYLDDGWFYVYRSGFVLQRFKLTKQDNGTYRITHLQVSEENGLSNTPIKEALYSVEHRWDLVSKDQLP